jgi:hypothetical protein
VIVSEAGGAVIDDPADARALARAIALYLHEDKRETARTVARSWMEQYPPERNVEETLRVYYDALEEG